MTRELRQAAFSGPSMAPLVQQIGPDWPPGAGCLRKDITQTSQSGIALALTTKVGAVLGQDAPIIALTRGDIIMAVIYSFGVPRHARGGYSLS
jgi:hypothetical protein